jgi:hypothetical protein
MTDKEIAFLESDIDQQLAECDAWFASSTEADQLSVFNAITSTQPNPIAEIVTRLAQLAFMQATVRHHKKGS